MTLVPQAQEFLDRLHALELPPFETLDAATQREIFNGPTEDGAEPTPVHSVAAQTFPGPVGPVPVRIYRPSDGSNLPAVIFFHGGGWVIGNLDSHDNLCRAMCSAMNAVVVSVAYRLAPEDVFPAAIDDSDAAVAWVAASAGELGIDGSRISVAGDSAGGNLAAAAAVTARDNGLALAAQLLIYPACNLHEPRTASYHENAEGYLLSSAWMDWFVATYAGGAEVTQDPRFSPALASSHEGLAPALVITAEYDPLRDDGERYAAALHAAGVPTELVRFHGQVHGFANQVGVMDDADNAVQAMTAFVAKHS